MYHCDYCKQKFSSLRSLVNHRTHGYSSMIQCISKNFKIFHIKGKLKTILGCKFQSRFQISTIKLFFYQLQTFLFNCFNAFTTTVPRVICHIGDSCSFGNNNGPHLTHICHIGRCEGSKENSIQRRQNDKEHQSMQWNVHLRSKMFQFLTIFMESML